MSPDDSADTAPTNGPVATHGSTAAHATDAARGMAAADGLGDGSSLVLTGERTLPGIPDEHYWFVRHEVAYHRVAALIDVEAAPTVLDAGCGEGYGLAVFAAAGAARVIGADLDAASVAHATTRYADDDARIEVVRCELSTLPLGDGAVDLVVSLQVIEHVWDVAGYLASLRRVTRPGGLITIATPNRRTFTPDSDVPVNPFHVTEFAPDELVTALEGAGLGIVSLHGLHHTGALAAFENHHDLSLPRHLGAVAASDWTPEVRARVRATTADDFRWTDDELDTSLDLLAVCRVLP